MIDKNKDVENNSSTSKISEALDNLIEALVSEGYSNDKKSFQESVSRMRRVYDDPKTSEEKKIRIKKWLDGAKKYKKNAVWESDNSTNESFNLETFNNEIMTPIVKDLYKCLDGFAGAFNYLEKNGQNSLIGDFKKKYNYNQLKSLIENLDSVTESNLEKVSYNTLLEGNEDAAKLLASWIEYSDVNEVAYNSTALKILENLTIAMESDVNENVYKVISEAFLGGKFFKEDRELIDSEMEKYNNK